MSQPAGTDPGATRASLAGAFPAWLMVAAVVVAAWIAFSHRPQPPFKPTQVYPDKLIVNGLARDGERLVAVGEQGRILIADGPQAPWREAAVAPQRGSTFTEVLALGDGVLLAVGHDGWIVRSEDHGATWKEVAYNLPAPAGAGGALPPDPFASADFGATPPAEGATAGDGGAAAADAPPAQSDPLLGIAGPYDGKLFAFGAFGLFLVSTDGGTTWTREVHETIGDRHLNAMARAGDGALILVGERGLMARSTDLGASWTLLPQVYSGSFYGLLALPSQALVAFGMRGNTFASHDAGASWQKAEVPLQQSLFGGTLGPKGEVILAGAANTILVSTDEGAHFTLASQKSRDTLTALLPLGGEWLTAGDGGIHAQRAAP